MGIRHSPTSAAATSSARRRPDDEGQCHLELDAAAPYPPAASSAQAPEAARLLHRHRHALPRRCPFAPEPAARGRRHPHRTAHFHLRHQAPPGSSRFAASAIAAASAGQNFISPDVFRLVRRELVLREEGAAIDEDRLFGNLLSSMPLTFNVLGPLALDLDLATAVFRQLLPGFVHTVTAIGFETSPGRGRPEYLHDGTAFDAALQIVTPDGEPGLVFVEMKYSEGMSGPAAAPRPRYDAASRQVRLFRDPDSPALRSVALEQLWREHMLAQLAVDLEFTPKAHFVAIGPRLNRQVTTAFKAYADQLAEPEA